MIHDAQHGSAVNLILLWQACDGRESEPPKASRCCIHGRRSHASAIVDQDLRKHHRESPPNPPTLGV
ncbi:MAG TPA: hypothetical protein V6D11_08545 [Waterburya sp.]